MDQQLNTIPPGPLRCGALDLLGVSGTTPTSSAMARRIGRAEAFVMDDGHHDVAQIHALEAALTTYLVARAGDGIVAVDHRRLERLVGDAEIVRIALLKSGLFPRAIGERPEVWSDAPLGRPARSVWIGFMDVEKWDGIDLVLRDLTQD